MLYGSKSTLVGGFYSDGGLIGVILLMAAMGFITRKMDGMLEDESPLIVKAVGVSWLGVMWIVWGSHDYWGLMTLGFVAIPGILFWLVSPKSRNKRIIKTKIYSHPLSINSQIKGM